MPDDCTAVYSNASSLCAADLSPAYAHCLSDDESSGIFGDYLIFWRCTAGSASVLFFLVPYLLMLLVALGSTADSFLMPQLTFLSDLLHLAPDVAGVTLLAFGNAAPDVFSAIAVATSDLKTSSKHELDLSFMLSDIIGGTLFINTVVVGSVTFLAGSHAPGWTIEAVPFWRDLGMLFVAVTFVLIVASDGSINLLEAVCFLLLHAVYVSVVLLLPRLLRRRRAGHPAGAARGPMASGAASGAACR